MEGFDEILEGLKVLHHEYDIVNLRAKRVDGSVANVCLQHDLPGIARRAFGMSEGGQYQAVWATLNPLAHMIPRGGAKDYDISARRWFPVDIDPVRGEVDADSVRRTDVPASVLECRHAESLCIEVASFLAARGWPEPVRAFGGNSYHLLYPTILPTGTELVACGLAAISSRFSTEAAVVDRTNGNASRVWKVYGTTSRKGDATADRPFRKSHLISVPHDSRFLSPAQISAVIEELSGVHVDTDMPTREFHPLPQEEWDRVLLETATLVEAWFTGIRGPKEYRGSRGDPGIVWEFTCPWVKDHAMDRWKAFVVLFRDGRHLSGCHGNRCRGSHQWADLVDEAMGI